MVIFRLLDRSVGLVSTAVLARLLLPEDFGLVAMAMAVIAVIDLPAAFRFEVGLIPMREPLREHYDTAWTLNVLAAAGAAVVTALAAWPAAGFFGDARVAPVMLAIGAAWLVAGMENVGMVDFRRRGDAGAEFRCSIIKHGVAFAITMVAAVTLRSYWALVSGIVAGRAAGVVLSYVMHPYRPRLSLARARELFSFSRWIYAHNGLSVAIARGPHFVVGRAWGASALGHYSVAAEIAQLASSELIAPINRAMFPGYARLAGDPPLFRRTCIDATAVILLIAVPVCVGIGVLAGPFVRVLLGPQWEAAVPLIQVLAVAPALTAITSNNVSIYVALGRPRLSSVAQLTRLGALVAGLLWISRTEGAIGVAYAELLAALAALAVSLPTLFITTGIRVRDYAEVLWRPALASALMGWTIWAGVHPDFHGADPALALLELVEGAVLGAVVYALAIALLWGLAGAPDAIEGRLLRRARAEIEARLAARRVS